MLDTSLEGVVEVVSSLLINFDGGEVCPLERRAHGLTMGSRALCARVVLAGVLDKGWQEKKVTQNSWIGMVIPTNHLFI